MAIMMNRSNSGFRAFIKLNPNCGFFRFVSHTHDYNLSPTKYQNVSKLEDALNLFDEMSHTQPLPSVVYFNQLLNSVTEMKHFSHSIHLFNQMCAIGVPVDDYTVSSAINCCCQLRRTNDAFALLGVCFRRAIVPDVLIFSALLDGLVLQDRILEAEFFFKKLIKQKLCKPNVVMFNTMIKGLCKLGNSVTAVSLLRLMDQKGCTPDVVTYNTIIDSLCKDTMIDDAFNLFKEMVFQKGVAPTVITYDTLISGLCKLSQWNEAYKMLNEMEEDHRISPDVHTYSILVDAFCKEGKMEEAESVIKIMVEKGKEPDIVTYTALIDGYCLRGEMNKARTVFDSMVFQGITPFRKQELPPQTWKQATQALKCIKEDLRKDLEIKGQLVGKPEKISVDNVDDFNEAYIVPIDSKCATDLQKKLMNIYDKVLVVDNISTAKEVVKKLTTQYRHLVHACDTEVVAIDVKQETPVNHGDVICFSIYSGHEADFGNGKSCIWVDVLDGGGKSILDIFSPFFEDPMIKKVWHN